MMAFWFVCTAAANYLAGIMKAHHRRALRLEPMDLSGRDGTRARLAAAGAHAGSGQDVSRPRLIAYLWRN